jgi:hypothetical protein
MFCSTDSFSKDSSETKSDELESHEISKYPSSSISQTRLIPQSNQTPPDSSSFNFEPYRSPMSNDSTPNLASGMEPAEEARESQGLISGSQAYDPLGVVAYNAHQGP